MEANNNVGTEECQFSGFRGLHGQGNPENVSFTLEDNKFVAITGPNGGGKSTLARMIAGIIKPVSGSILLDGQDITNLSVTERARLGISYAFQQPVRFKGVQVIDLLRLAAKKKLTVAEACQYLAEVGLCAKDYINREVNASLSGASSSGLRLPRYLPGHPSSPCLTSRKRELICGASKT